MSTIRKRYLIRPVPFQIIAASKVGRKSVDVTQSSIVLDWTNLDEIVFVGANSSGIPTAIGGNKSISVSNTTNAVKGTFSFSVSVQCVLTMPSNFIMSGFLDWDNTTKQLNLYPGKYLITFLNDATNFLLTLDGPL